LSAIFNIEFARSQKNIFLIKIIPLPLHNVLALKFTLHHLSLSTALQIFLDLLKELA